MQQTNFYTAQFHGMVAYYNFEGITIHAAEGLRLFKSIGDRPAVILRNHGLLAWGQTLPQTSPKGTVYQHTHFLRAAVNDDFLVDAKVLRFGKSTAYAKATVAFAASGELVVRASAEFAFCDPCRQP